MERPIADIFVVPDQPHDDEDFIYDDHAPEEHAADLAGEGDGSLASSTPVPSLPQESSRDKFAAWLAKQQNSDSFKAKEAARAEREQMMKGGGAAPRFVRVHSTRLWQTVAAGSVSGCYALAAHSTKSYVVQQCVSRMHLPC